MRDGSGWAARRAWRANASDARAECASVFNLASHRRDPRLGHLPRLAGQIVAWRERAPDILAPRFNGSRRFRRRLHLRVRAAAGRASAEFRCALRV